MHKDPEQIKAKILQAAMERFSKVGFQKTNVREIAQDCDMSPANLYRFFDGKDELGVAVVSRHIAQTQRIVNEVLALDGNASTKIKSFVGLILEYNFEIFNRQPNIFELIQFISQKKPELPRKHVMIKKNCLVEILVQGQLDQEIQTTTKVRSTGHLLFQALRAYLLPFSLINSPVPLSEWKQEADDLIDLLFAGLSPSP